MVDNRVERLVVKYRPSITALYAKIRRCPLKGEHRVIVNYGLVRKDRRKIGMITETCSKEDCPWNGQLTALQMHPRDRMLCLEDVAALEPAPFEDHVWATWCANEAVEIFRAHAGFPDILDALPPPPPGLLDRLHVPGPTPSLPKPVRVYIFMADGEPPLFVEACGTFRRNTVSFLFYQTKIIQAVKRARPPNTTSRFLVWDRLTSGWRRAVVSKFVPLMQDEGLVYKCDSIRVTPAAGFYITITTPPTLAANSPSGELTEPSRIMDSIEPTCAPACLSSAGDDSGHGVQLIGDRSLSPTLQFVEGSSTTHLKEVRGTKRAAWTTPTTNKRLKTDDSIVTKICVSKGKGKAVELEETCELRPEVAVECEGVDTT